jgi:hypothetical protein
MAGMFRRTGRATRFLTPGESPCWVTGVTGAVVAVPKIDGDLETDENLEAVTSGGSSAHHARHPTATSTKSTAATPQVRPCHRRVFSPPSRGLTSRADSASEMSD